MKTKSNSNNFIKEIYVENLFGYYTYTIPYHALLVTDNPLLIIYGDNGCGKTTVLELVFHLISTLDRSGRKTKIAGVKFSKVKVSLANGISIVARREEPTDGSYYFDINKNNKQLYSVPLIADHENAITMQNQPDEDIEMFNKILQFIENLSIEVFYLTDGRKILSGTSHEYISYPGNDTNQLSKISRLKILGRKQHLEENDELDDAIRNLENWIRKKVLIGSRKGDQNTNVIYSEIVKRITSSNANIVDVEQKALELKKQLKNIRTRSSSFYKNGLLSQVDSKHIEEVLVNSRTKEKLKAIYSVIEPYAEGLQSKLDSLQEIQELILLFTKSVNSYFTNKKLIYHLSTGFRLKFMGREDPLDFKMLSSGERQLLLLFCYIITASEEATIFIIDEPEISLNIKWQRRLGATLSEFARGRNVQFILATHSIELLSGHEENVCKLINQKS